MRTGLCQERIWDHRQGWKLSEVRCQGEPGSDEAAGGHQQGGSHSGGRVGKEGRRCDSRGVSEVDVAASGGFGGILLSDSAEKFYARSSRATASTSDITAFTSWSVVR